MFKSAVDGFAWTVRSTWSGEEREHINSSALRVRPGAIRELTDKLEDRGEYVSPSTANNMTNEQRRVVDDVITMVVHGNQSEKE